MRGRQTDRHREIFSSYQDEDISSLLVGLRRLDLACELQARVRQATNCAVLYHHTVILPTYLTHYMDTLEHVHRIHVREEMLMTFLVPLFCTYNGASLFLY